MTNGNPRNVLKPVALALVTMFYMMVNRLSDSQRSATWTFDRYDTHQVPLGYKARLKLELIFDDNGTHTPKRRAGENGVVLEDLTSDQSIDK